jgi:hypothetical protein
MTSGDLIRPRDILGNAEVRKTCGGVTRHTLLTWRAKHAFPAPIRKLEQGELWDRIAVRTWYTEWKRGTT